MVEQHQDDYYIRDTSDGMINLSRVPFDDDPNEPSQIIAITGRPQVAFPKSVMTRKQFAEWRLSLEEQGYTVELRFA